MQSLLIQNESLNTTLPKFQCMSYVKFLWCEIPIVHLEYIIREETCPSMHYFTGEIRNDSYMFQLQSSHQTVCMRSIKGNHIPVVYIQLQIISGRYFGITYKGMRLLPNMHLKYKNYYCTKINN